MTTATRRRPPAEILPHNLDAERAVLGCILHEGAAALGRVAARLTATDFLTDAHRVIFAAMLRLHRAGQPVDLVTLQHALAEADELAVAGGAPGLALLIEQGAIAVNLDSYLGIVADQAGKRTILTLAEHLAHGARNGTSAESLIADIKAAAATLGLHGSAAEPEMVREGLDLALVWPGDLRLTLTAVRIGRDGVKGELTVAHAGRRLHWGAVNLANLSGREQLVKKLREVLPALPWRQHLEDACARLTAAARQGTPIAPLAGTVPQRPRDLVPRLVLDAQTSVIFADGGSGKSLLALAIAAAVASGPDCWLPGGLRPSRQAPVLYLDWEACRDEQEERLAYLCAGLGIDPPAIDYRPMTHALTDDVAMLAADVARRGTGLVVIDSLAPACGPEPDGTDAVVRTMNALQMFPASRLVLAHMSKAEADKRAGTAHPFGSVFVWNLARSVWELRRDEEDTEGLTIALTHRKANTGRRHPPFGLRFVFGDKSITPYPVDLAAKPELTAGTSLAWRLRMALAKGRTSAEALAEELNADVQTVARTLRRFRKEGKAQDFEDGTWGLLDQVGRA